MITEIKEYTFSKCRFLVEITIPSSVTSIGDSAFSECSSLTKITNPSCVSVSINKSKPLTQKSTISSKTSNAHSAQGIRLNTKIITFATEIITFVTEIITFVTEIITFVTEIITFVTEIITFVTEIITFVMENKKTYENLKHFKYFYRFYYNNNSCGHRFHFYEKNSVD